MPYVQNLIMIMIFLIYDSLDNLLDKFVLVESLLATGSRVICFHTNYFYLHF